MWLVQFKYFTQNTSFKVKLLLKLAKAMRIILETF